MAAGETMRRGAWGALMLALLAGCPSTTANTPGRGDAGGGDAKVSPDASDAASDAVSDVGDAAVEASADASTDADAGADADAGGDGGGDAGVDVTMTIEFSSAALVGDAGAVSMRANMTWHGTLRGRTDGGITFEGEIRGGGR
ncbi:MAG: hypothetical protein U0324_34355 [Polyangiales bacterium]